MWRCVRCVAGKCEEEEMILTKKQKSKALKNLVAIGETIGKDDVKAMVKGTEALAELACQIGGIPMMLAVGKVCFDCDMQMGEEETDG